MKSIKRIVICIIVSICTMTSAFGQFPTIVFDEQNFSEIMRLKNEMERLNNSFFGGKGDFTIVNDITEIVTMSRDLLDHNMNYLNQAKQLAQTIGNINYDGTLSGAIGNQIDRAEWAYSSSKDIYDYNQRQIQRIIDIAKGIRGSGGLTTDAKHEALQAEKAKLKVDQELARIDMMTDLASTQDAMGLTMALNGITPNPKRYVQANYSKFGKNVNNNSLKNAIAIIIGLLLIAYGFFAGIHIFKGSGESQVIIARLFIILGFSTVILISIF